MFLLGQTGVPTFAAIRAETPRTLSASTGGWSAVAHAQGQAPTNSAYTISWTVNSGKARDFFTIRNTGNFTMTGVNATVSQSQTSNSRRPPNTTFDWCRNGTWSSSTNTCSSSDVVLMGTASDIALSITFTNLNLLPNAELSMRATTQPNLQFSYSSTISIFVSRSQVRMGSTTNS